MLTMLFFTLGIIVATTMLLLSLFSLVYSGLRFWPPPSKNSWQYYLFWTLFRVQWLSVLALVVLEFPTSATDYTWFNMTGLIMTVVGFLLAFYATFSLGWGDSHGIPSRLKTNGLFKWSRHPIYLFSIIGIMGIALLVNSGWIYILNGFWCIIYLIAPWLEEPWLEERYGDAYTEYKARTPRFIGIPRAQISKSTTVKEPAMIKEPAAE